MDNIKDLPTLSDSDLVNVAGGSADLGNPAGLCGACGGVDKKLLLNVRGKNWIVCRDCGKTFPTCPICGAAWEGAENWTGSGWVSCVSNHIFSVTYNG